MDKTQILKEIQRHYKFTKDGEFADFLGIKPNTLSNWLKRGVFDYDVVITKCDEIDANWIFNDGEGSMLKHPEKFGIVTARDYKNMVPMVVTVDSDQNDNIVFVPVRAQAGYLSGYGDDRFIKNLPSYRLPNLNNGTFRMFQVEGLSMYPTLTKNSIVVGQWVENWENEVKDNKVYVVVSRDEGVIVKRVINRISKYNNLMCKSDNRNAYPTINIEPATIAEIWEVKLHLNFELPDPADIYDRVTDLEAELMNLKTTIKSLN